MHMHFDYGTEGQSGAMFDDARHAENPFSSNLPNSDKIEYLITDIIRKADALSQAFSTASHGGGSVAWSTAGHYVTRRGCRTRTKETISGRRFICSRNLLPARGRAKNET
jgi:hypothetical protein